MRCNFHQVGGPRTSAIGGEATCEGSGFPHKVCTPVKIFQDSLMLCQVAELAASNTLRQFEVHEIEPLTLTSMFQYIWVRKAVGKGYIDFYSN